MYIYVYSLNVVQHFRSDSSFYCYRPVSYGQRVTTLIRQHQRMTGKFIYIDIKMSFWSRTRYTDIRDCPLVWLCINMCTVQLV